jgi:VanZ family protein
MPNEVPRPRWWKALGAWAPALLWSLMIFRLSAIPGDALPPMPGWWNADKLLHGLVYAVLGALCWYGARGTLPRVRGPVHQVIAAALITTLYGISDEMHQSVTPGRSPDAFDVIADAVGGLLGALVCVAIVARKDARAASARRVDG